MQAVVSANAGAVITLTGHSLGGALAQLVGEASDFAVAAFNAPGGQALYGQLSSELAPADGLGYGGTDINYIVDGDQVSFAGVPIGQQFTINGPYGINASSSPGDIAANMLNNHIPRSQPPHCCNLRRPMRKVRPVQISSRLWWRPER